MKKGIIIILAALFVMSCSACAKKVPMAPLISENAVRMQMNGELEAPEE